MSKNQLKNYIRNGDFEYIIDRKKLLNDGVLDPDAFVKGEFQKVFKENAEELFDLMPQSLKMALSVSENAIELTDSQLYNLLNMIIKVE